MTPLQVKLDGIPDTTWLCKSCDHTWYDLVDAELCCKVRPCAECKKSVLSGNLLCSECSVGDRMSLEKALYEKAFKVYYLDYEEPLFHWSQLSRPAKFFRTRTELDRFCLDRSTPPPRWVWGTAPKTIKLDAKRLLEASYPGLETFLEDEPVEALQAFLDDWSAKQEVKEYKIDYNVAVILDPQLFEELRTSYCSADD